MLWDYLLVYGDKTEEDLRVLTFSGRIELLNIRDSKWLGKLIAWVGNDRAHPFQRHMEMSTNDMKVLHDILITEIVR